jgi:hypothetical protein
MSAARQVEVGATGTAAVVTTNSESDETGDPPEHSSDTRAAARVASSSRRVRRRTLCRILGGLLLLSAAAPGGARAQQAEVGPGESRLVLAGSTTGPRLERAVIDRGLRFLAQRATPSGQIGTSYPVAVTSLAGMAFLGAGHRYGGGPYAESIQSCVRYILASRGPEGLISSDRSGIGDQSRMHQHCFALLFLTQVYGELPPGLQQDVRDTLVRGITGVLGAQSYRGGWDYEYLSSRLKNHDEASITIGVLQALRAARNGGIHIPANRVDNALEYVRMCQDERDGSFRYSISRNQQQTSFSLTAAAVSTLQAAGVYDSLELRRGLDALARDLDAVGWQPQRAVNEPFFFYGAFYASQAYFHVGGTSWDRWYEAIRDYLVKKQEVDGSWDDDYGREYGTAMAVLILEIPVQYLPIFQR